MNITYEYLENGKWIKCNADYLRNLAETNQFDQLVHREIVPFFNGPDEYWYLGHKLHRLDGPAYVAKKKIIL